MDPWWWVPIGLAAWSLVGFAMALCLGPVLRRASQVREAPDQQLGEDPDEPHDSPGDEEGQGSLAVARRCGVGPLCAWPGQAAGRTALLTFRGVPCH